MLRHHILKKILAGYFLLVFYGFPVQVMASEEQFHRFWPDNLFAVEFVSEKVGFISGQAGTVLRTNDAGENWEAFFIGKPELIRRMSFVSESEGWAVGHRGSIFHTADSGRNWDVQHSSEKVYLRDIKFFDNKHGWAVGHGAEILHTNDGGLHWERQSLTAYKGRDLPRLHGIEVIDQQTAVLVGEFGIIAHTENAGEYWKITPVETTVTWLSVAASKDCIYIVGLDGSGSCLTKASEEQSKKIALQRAEKIAKEQEKSRKKALRRGEKYTLPEEYYTPESDVEYVVKPIETGSTEHLFDVVKMSDGGAVAVGRSTIIRLMRNKGVSLIANKGLPIDYLWFGGIDFSSTTQFWAAGIKGLVVKGDVSKMNYAFTLSLPESKNISLITSRWVTENGK